jgi:hypothetical protein
MLTALETSNVIQLRRLLQKLVLKFMFTNCDECAYCYNLISDRENTRLRKWILSLKFNLDRIYTYFVL